MDLPEAIKVIEDMEKDEQHKKDTTGIEHGMFIDGKNTPQKKLQHFTTFFMSIYLMR